MASLSTPLDASRRLLFVLVTTVALNGACTRSPGPLSSQIVKWTAKGVLHGKAALEGKLQATIAPKRRVRLVREVEVSPDTTYYVQLRVRTTADVVMQVGKRRLPYLTPGRRQLLADFVQSDSTGKPLRISIDVSTGEEEAVLELDDLRLDAASELPPTPFRPLFGSTTVASEGAPRALIVYPGGEDASAHRSLAMDLRAAVRDLSGVELEVISDIDATRPDAPVLRPRLRRSHLIILGRLDLNRALWVSYNRFLSAVDGYYPGGDGHVVRTASNVLGNGKNHIIVGGSTLTGVRNATRRFRQLLRTRGTAGRGELHLPSLLDVRLSGTAKEAMNELEQRWQRNIFDRLLPKREPGYQSIARFYVNAMAYYWSGRPSFLARAKMLLDVALNDDAEPHHYVLEFLVRALDMLDDGLALGLQRTRRADRMLLRVFERRLLADELRWMPLLRPPYDAIRLANRHRIASLFSDLQLAKFVGTRFQLSPRLRNVVDYRTQEKASFFDHCVRQRWKSTLPRLLGWEHRSALMETLFRHALHTERYEFFRSGNARRALALPELSPALPRRVDYKLLLGILASYTASSTTNKSKMDTTYHQLGQQVLALPPYRSFQWRILAGLHRYAPGPARAVKPRTLAAVQRTGFMRQDRRLWRGVRFRRRRSPRVPIDRSVELISFRSGYGPSDLIMTLRGFGQRPGAVNQLWSSGQRLLTSLPGETFYGNANAISVLPLDAPPSTRKLHPSAAELNYLSDNQGRGAASLTMRGFADTTWRRDVIWLGGGRFVVRDTVRAIRAGDYIVKLHWHPRGQGQRKGNILETRLGKTGLRLQLLTPGFELAHRVARPGQTTLTATRRAYLPAGALLKMTSVLEVLPASPPLVVRGSPLEELELSRGGATVAQLSWQPGRRNVAAHPLGFRLPAASPGRPDAAAPKALSPKRLRTFEPRTRPLWRRRWTYRGLQRPALLPNPKHLGRGVYDFGKAVSLAEVRSTRASRHNLAARLPAKLRFAGPRRGRTPLQFQVPRGQRIWSKGIDTGNYGEVHPSSRSFQRLELHGLRARYVQMRPRRGTRVVFFGATTKKPRTPTRIVARDLDGDGKPELLLLPDIHPKFLRPSRYVESPAMVAALRPDGRALLERSFPRPVHDARVLNMARGPRLHVLTADGRLRRFDAHGAKTADISLYRLHADFHRREGRRYTRHPAGGYAMPFAVGLWRPRRDGPLQSVIARYAAYSFLDSADRLVGVNMAAGYTVSQLLPRGFDVDGDGAEETFALARGSLWRIQSSPSPYVTDPNGVFYFPQLHKTERLLEPAHPGGLDGSRTFVFAAQPQSSAVIVVRRSYVGIADAKRLRWRFAWAPPEPIVAATIAPETRKGALELFAAVGDDLLWRLRWDNTRQAPKKQVYRLAGTRIRALSAPGAGCLLLATNRGLYRMSDDGRLRQIAAGRYRSVVGLRGAVFGLTDDGRVERYEAL